MGQAHVSEPIAELLRNVHKLGVSDWSPGLGTYPTSHLTSPELRDEIAAHTAALSVLFGESDPSKVPLEAYLWSAPVRRHLKELGWLQGGVVVVDKFGTTQITRLEVDLPSRALRLPVIQPLQTINCQRMAPSCFGQAWEEINRRAFLFPKVDSERRQPLLAELRDWVYDGGGRPEEFPDRAQQDLSQHLKSMAEQVPGYSSSSSSPFRIYEALADHLAAAVMSAHFVSLNRARVNRRTSFLEFMNRERKDITRIARENAVLWVPDGEISFLLLEYLSTSLQPVFVGGQLVHQNYSGRSELSQDVFTGLGLLPAETGLAKRMAVWVRDLLGMQGYDPEQHAVLSPLMDNPFWVWLKRQCANRGDRALDALHPLLEGSASIGKLRNFCQEFSRSRTPAELESEGPLNCQLALFQRWMDPKPRYIVAFQFSPWSKSLQSGSRTPRRVAYFIGTFRPVDGMDLSQQILLVRTLVSSAQWPTMHNLLEEERALDRVSYFFVHDLYNRVWELSSGMQMLLREAEDRGEATLQDLAAEASNNVQGLYGTARLLADLQKAAGGFVSADWAEKARLPDWPRNLSAADFQEIAARCHQALREAVAGYVSEMRLRGRSFMVRRVSLKEPAVLEEIDARDLPRMSAAGLMPPFDPNREEGPRAMLATLVELVRNAVKGIIRDDTEYEHFSQNGALHLDYEIEVKRDSVQVTLWNPIYGEKLPRPELLERVRNLLFNRAVEITTPDFHAYPLGTSQGVRWVRSTYEYFPARLKFRS